MSPKTKKLLDELEAFIWYRTDEQDEDMIEKLVNHIKEQDNVIEEIIKEGMVILEKEDYLIKK